MPPRVDANRCFHVIAQRFPHGSIRNIGLGGGGIFIMYPVLDMQLTPAVTANRYSNVQHCVFPEALSETFDLHVLLFENDKGRE